MSNVTLPLHFAPVAVGQSLLGNYAPIRYPPLGKNFRTHFNGECSPLGDPVRGGGGQGGSIWVPLIAQLVEQRGLHHADVTVLSMPGATIAELGPSGALFRQARFEQIYRHRIGLKTSHVLIQQGQGDLREGTSPTLYEENLERVVRAYQELFTEAYVFIATDSFRTGRVQEDLASAQRRVQDKLRLQDGPDFNQLSIELRSDGTHYNARGQEAAAKLWAETIASSLAPETEGNALARCRSEDRP